MLTFQFFDDTLVGPIDTNCNIIAYIVPHIVLTSGIFDLTMVGPINIKCIMVTQMVPEPKRNLALVLLPSLEI